MDASLQLLLDKQAITETIYRYCRGLDRKDRATLASAYWEDARDDHAGLFSASPPGVIDHLIETTRDMRTMHVVANILIERVSPTVAVSEAYVFSYHVTSVDGALRELVGAGRYIDRHEKRGAEWRIVHRQVAIDLMRDTPAHETLAAFPRVVIGGRPAPDDLIYGALAAGAQEAPHATA